MVFEDVHWADPTSVELLTLTIERLQTLPVLLVITFRPDYQPPWSGQPHVTMLTLNRLSQRERATLVGHITGGKALPPGLARPDRRAHRRRAAVRRRTDQGATGKRAVARGPRPLRARTADPAIGDPDHAAGFPDGAGRPARLGARGVADRRRHRTRIFLRSPGRGRRPAGRGAARRPDPPDRSRAVVRCAAPRRMRSIRSSTRWSRTPPIPPCCARGASSFTPRSRWSWKSDSRRSSSTTPELVAQQFERAGQTEKAIQYWRQAADRDLRRFAMKESIAHYSNALRLVTAMPESRHRDGLELTARLGLGLAQQIAHRPDGQGTGAQLSTRTGAEPHPAGPRTRALSRHLGRLVPRDDERATPWKRSRCADDLLDHRSRTRQSRPACGGLSRANPRLLRVPDLARAKGSRPRGHSSLRPRASSRPRLLFRRS